MVVEKNTRTERDIKNVCIRAFRHKRSKCSMQTVESNALLKLFCRWNTLQPKGFKLSSTHNNEREKSLTRFTVDLPPEGRTWY